MSFSSSSLPLYWIAPFRFCVALLLLYWAFLKTWSLITNKLWPDCTIGRWLHNINACLFKYILGELGIKALAYAQNSMFVRSLSHGAFSPNPRDAPRSGCLDFGGGQVRPSS